MTCDRTPLAGTTNVVRFPTERRARRLSIEAYALTEHAEGVARAVDCARRGEAWLPDTSNVGTVAVLTGATGLPGYKAAVRPVGARTRKARTAAASTPPTDRPCA